MRLRSRALALMGALGVAAGALANLLSVSAGGAELSLPGAFLLFAVMAGGVALYLGRQVGKYANRKTRQDAKSVNPLLAARVAVYAQAVALTGSLVAGWQVAILVYQLGLVGSRSSDMMVETTLALLGGVVLLVSGIIAENWCKIPPGDDEEGGGTPAGRVAQPGPLVRGDKS